MKLFYSPHSPFVRKVLIVAHELSLFDRIELLRSDVGPVKLDRGVSEANPLGQVPTFLTDDGDALSDSRVICEFLNHLGRGTMFADEGASHWHVLTEASLADGLLDAALLMRYEQVLRPREFRWDKWIEGHSRKIATTLDHFSARVESLSRRVDIGTITLGCGISYLDHRHPELAWRTGRGKLAAWYEAIAARPSFAATALGIDLLETASATE